MERSRLSRRRFVVGEAIYSEWEIRRMALEQLFFEEEETSD